MNEVNIADTVLKTAEKVAAIDLKKVGRKARELNADSIGTVTRKFVNAINPHCPERTEKRIQATLDIAYLLGNLGGWYSEKQEKRFEEIAANLGRKPSDVSPDAVGLNAKLAHLRSRISEDDLLAEFINGVRNGCESFGGLLVPSRRAFALWVALGLADGEMPELSAGGGRNRACAALAGLPVLQRFEQLKKRRTMCTILLKSETLPTEKRSRKDTQKAVDRLMAYDRQLSFGPSSGEESRKAPFFEDHPYGICSIPWGRGGKVYVWLENCRFGNSRKNGFYYVRYQRSMHAWGSTAYAHPALIVQKSKLRPDQVEYMERKCRETLDAEQE